MSRIEFKSVVSKIVKVLKQSPTAIKNREAIADSIGTPVYISAQLNSLYRTGTITPHEYFKAIVDSWVSRNGGKANSQSFAKLLREMNCHAEADQLEDHGPNEPIATSSPACQEDLRTREYLLIPSTLSTKQNLLPSEQGTSKETVSVFKEVLRTREDFVGVTHPDTRIAISLEEQGNPEEAIPIHTEVLRSREDVDGLGENGHEISADILETKDKTGAVNSVSDPLLLSRLITKLNSLYNQSESTTPYWLDGLKLSQYLGHGSFGFVLHACAEDGMEYALKIVVLADLDLNVEKDKMRIEREYNLMKDKEHKHIVKIISSSWEAFEVKDVEVLQQVLGITEDIQDKIDLFMMKARRRTLPTFCIKMELCGKNLRHWLRSDRAEVKENKLFAYNVLCGMVSGISFLHTSNILHRDIRPENVLFAHSLSGEFALPVKLGDFGLCRAVADTSETVSFTEKQGNVFYRAPEANHTKYGKQADLFSLGLTMWEVVQTIPQPKLKDMFHKLVYEGQTQVIELKQDDTLNRVPSLGYFIVCLTKKEVSERMKDIEGIVEYFSVQ